MQDKFIQGVRYKLQRRVRRLNSVGYHQFSPLLSSFFLYLENTPILAGVRDELLARTAKYDVPATIQKVFNGVTQYGDNEEEEAAMGYHLLKQHASAPDKFSVTRLEYGGSSLSDMLDRMREVFLEPFYEYLDEHIDDQQAILYFLRRYKHRCEWFHAKRLRELLESDTQAGERALAMDLYEFLHEEGIDLQIEPKSASGIADLVAEQVGNERVVADAKIFWPAKSKGKTYLLSAFHQAYTYARDFNESCAYLVIYKMATDDINFLMPTSATNSMFPNMSLNNKTIFFIVVDICEYGASASKRNVLRSIDITAADLVQSVQEDASSGGEAT